MNYKMKKDGGPKKMKKGGKKKISYLAAKKGGAKPDYLDMDKDGNKTEPMKNAVKDKAKAKGKKKPINIKSPADAITANKPYLKAKNGGERRMMMKKLKEDQKEMRKGMKEARKEQRGQDREERKDNRARKKAVRKIKKAFRGKGMAKRMGDGGMRKRQTGGFLEMPTFDLDRDSI